MLFPDKDTKHTSPRWLRYLLLGFMGFVIIRGFFLQDNDGNNAVERFQQLDGVQRVTSDTYMNKLTNPKAVVSSNPRFSFITSQPGAGDGAICGDIVDLKIRGSLEDGSAFDESFDESQPLTVRLGAGNSITAIEKAALGIKQGEARKVEAPADMVYGEGDERREYKGRVVFNIERVDALPMVAAENHMPLMQKVQDRGEGVPAHCGDDVTLQVDRWNAQGDLRPFDAGVEGSLTGRLGAFESLPALNQIGVGMAVGAKHVATVPPRFAGAAEELLVLQVRRVK